MRALESMQIKCWRIGRMTRDFNGKFTRWKKDEVVKVARGRVKGVPGLHIEKLKPVRPFLPLRSACICIPRAMVEILKGHPLERLKP